MNPKPTVTLDVPAPAQRAAWDTIKEVHQGTLVDDIDRELHRACCAVAATGKAASVTITLNITPADREVNTSRVFFHGKATSKLPTLAKAASLFYLDANQNPTLMDPNQRVLELKAVEAPAPVALRDVTAAGGGPA